MPFVDCPACGVEHKQPRELIGLEVNCPKCGASFTLADDGEAIISPPVLPRRKPQFSGESLKAVGGGCAAVVLLFLAVAFVVNLFRDRDGAGYTTAVPKAPNPNDLDDTLEWFGRNYIEIVNDTVREGNEPSRAEGGRKVQGLAGKLNKQKVRWRVRIHAVNADGRCEVESGVWKPRSDPPHRSNVLPQGYIVSFLYATDGANRQSFPVAAEDREWIRKQGRGDVAVFSGIIDSATSYLWKPCEWFDQFRTLRLDYECPLPLVVSSENAVIRRP